MVRTQMIVRIETNEGHAIEENGAAAIVKPGEPIDTLAFVAVNNPAEMGGGYFTAEGLLAFAEMLVDVAEDMAEQEMDREFDVEVR